jgi:hypothetical protein
LRFEKNSKEAIKKKERERERGTTTKTTKNQK